MTIAMALTICLVVWTCCLIGASSRYRPPPTPNCPLSPAQSRATPHLCRAGRGLVEGKSPKEMARGFCRLDFKRSEWHAVSVERWGCAAGPGHVPHQRRHGLPHCPRLPAGSKVLMSKPRETFWLLDAASLPITFFSERHPKYNWGAGAQAYYEELVKCQK